MQLNVLIEQQHEGRVFITELSDHLVHNSMPLSSYSVGQSVLVKVIRIRRKRRRKSSDTIGAGDALGAGEAVKKKSFHFADCTMKESKLKAKSAKKRVIGYKEDFRKGDTVTAVIEELARRHGVGYSCHVAVNPNWKGVVPILHLSPDIEVLKNPLDHFSRGQVIIGRVTGIQSLEKHLQLTCLSSKKSTISAGVKTRVVVTETGPEIKCRLIDGTSGFIERQAWTESTEAEPGDVLEVRPLNKTGVGNWRLALERYDPSQKQETEFTFESVVSKKKIKEEPQQDEVSVAAEKMKEASRFQWNTGRFGMANLMGVWLGGKEGRVKKESVDAVAGPAKNFEQGQLEEEQIFQKEMTLLNSDREVQTTEDFDRLVMGSPDSSLVWIRYMAFFLQQGDVSKARDVAEKALKTISVREENERFNLWAALLNLEDAYGTSESFRKVFDEAVIVNEPLKVYELATKILKRSNKVEECDAFYEEMLTKFKSEFSVWISFGDYYMATSRADRARNLMKRAMKSLPQSRHVDLVSRFAQMEYRYSITDQPIDPVGDAERGRTLFENILRDYPKRTDVWSVYIDMTSKYQSMEEARPLLERVTSLKLNTHKLRLFYKKWIDLEERRGTPETLGQAKKRAAVYVKDALAMMPGTNAQDEQELADVEMED